MPTASMPRSLSAWRGGWPASASWHCWTTSSRRVARWPTITAELISRVARRARALALSHAASHLSHAHARLAVAFWLLGERWGRVGTEGISITLPLTHETLSMLVGVRRPTVTLALKRLGAAGLLERRGADRWLLTNRAVEALSNGDGLRLDAADHTGESFLGEL